MRKIVMPLCIIAIICPCMLFAQSPGDGLQSKILNSITAFYQAYPQEQVHLHFNKNAYAPGEDIWFKSYLLPFNDTLYNSISKIEYVELIDLRNILVKRLVLPVTNGAAEGHFKLGEGFSEGMYHVRAYTAWMLNFDTVFFFNRDIPVFSHNSAYTLQAGKNYTVQFYPEGGNLVNGLTSLVAYKATDENGNPVIISGALMDDKGNTRAILHTGADGMGSFNMHPEDGFNYIAVTRSSTDTAAKTFQLPEIKKSGVVLHVVDKPDSAGNSKLYFHIARSKLQKELYANIIVCAHTARYNRMLNINFDPKYAGDYNDTILVAADPIELRNEGENIAHITIFNNQGEPIAERMIFLHDASAMRTPLLEAVSLDATGKNQLSLQVPGDDNGQYSVSVTNYAGEKWHEENSIYSDYYLGGIQHYISNPALFFTDTTNVLRNRLNLLMLTGKWQYFTWHNILAKQFPDIVYHPEQSLVIKGNVYVEKYGKKESFEEKSLPLMMRADRDSFRTLLNIAVDDKGDFIEGGLSFHDTASFYYMGSQAKSKKMIKVTLDKTETDSVLALPFRYQPYRNFKFAETLQHPLTKPQTEEYSQHTNDSNMLKAVTVRALAKTRIDSLDAVYAAGIFSGTAGFVRAFDLTDDPVVELDHVTNVLQYLQGRVPGLSISGDLQNVPEMYWRLTTGLFTNNRAVDPAGATILNMPVFFIDGRQVNSNVLIGSGSKEQLSATMSQLTSLKVADIAYIKVYEPGTFYGTEGGAAHGAIAIYLKKGYDNKNANMSAVTKAGYSWVPEFKDGEYSAAAEQAIYWNPGVHTNAATHSAIITFTNNTAAKKIKVVVEGIDKKGSVVRVEKIFEMP
ncbi:MAG TPA: hypothetical protein VHB48_05170 [Chitinophagaceae bacterium]|nr:hypothetical protein [Chitinophagaceae bacterium]